MSKWQVTIMESGEFEADDEFEAEEMAKQKWEDRFRARAIDPEEDDTE